MAEVINLEDALLTMPVKPAFGGYDGNGDEVTVNVYQLKLLMQDGRTFIHSCMGDKIQIEALECKIRTKGNVNLDYWYQIKLEKNRVAR